MPDQLLKITPTTPSIEPTSYLEPEYQPHYDAWKAAPGPKTATPLLKAVQPVVDSAIRSYGGRTASPMLKSRAKLLAYEGIQRYDPTRSKLRTHLLSHLQGLRRMSVQESQIIPIPERIAMDSYHLRQSESELEDKLGRSPSTAELSDHTNLSPRRIAKIRRAQPGVSEGQVTGPVGDPGEENASVGPAVSGGGGEALWQNFVYHDLGPEDQLIMEHSLGMHGRPVLSKQMIARKLRLSPGAISQRAAKIQQKLDRREELGGEFFGG